MVSFRPLYPGEPGVSLAGVKGQVIRPSGVRLSRMRPYAKDQGLFFPQVPQEQQQIRQSRLTQRG